MSENVDLFADDDDDRPLVPHDCGNEGGDGIYDESGELMLAASLGQSSDRPMIDPRILEPIREPLPVLQSRPCPVRLLDGSWYLEILGGVSLFQTRGALRIEATGTQLRASGDMYTSAPVIGPIGPIRTAPTHLADLELKLPPEALVIRRNWYPNFPQREYSWYLRSTGVSYVRGVLLVTFTRHLWSRQQQGFVSTDRGWLRLTCRQGVVKLPTFPQPTMQLTGTAMIGGQQRQIRATKTSPYYRGCVVEVDVMTNRNWVSSAATPGGTVTFTGVYRSHGLDFRAVVNDTNVPEDANLTVAELHALMDTHRSLQSSPKWHL